MAERSIDRNTTTSPYEVRISAEDRPTTGLAPAADDLFVRASTASTKYPFGGKSLR